MNIRKEEIKDYDDVFKLIENAFKDEEFSDHQEQFLVERLRKSTSFIPELSLVAEMDNQIVGYILLTKIKIINVNFEETISLALAPVAVLKKYQGKGIGGQLIVKAHKIAKDLNFNSVILLGHENYYPKFGYEMSNKYGIKLPFDVPDENCMLIELTENALKNINGIVEYPKEFYE
ncbi:putative N-acetyltransferase YhbS [Myroides gitamensis]|uniref:GNAT family N-acetyltransferase n=1 Tax=Myroides odoratus TaxID=256 RepID=UPI002169D082|nr:N-acetyltransferase [Myroides odoratus]MCS4240162.1 putative N-acetyltransferase YhbS [Myroides odoratus]MDH6601087.1 putative N-acetyltransferase YhbS [Myroides gitamensis]